MTVRQQKTFGAVMGIEPVLPIAPHESDERVCIECNEQTSIADWEGSTECCNDCVTINHTPCTHSGEWVHDADIVENNRGDGYSDYNVEEENKKCTGCLDWVHRDDIQYSPAGNGWCDDCYYERFRSCDNCGETHDRDDSIYDDGSHYCPDCSHCASRDEWDAPVSRVGSAEYDKVGSCRTFGVELETDVCDGHEDWAYDTGFACTDDGSINGKEFVSPICNGNAGYDLVRGFVETMDRNGAEVSADCGFHLHIGVSDVSEDGIKSIALAYHYARNVFEGWVDESRRDTYYARRNVNSKHGHSDQWDADDIKDCHIRPDSTTRYVWINWKAYDRFKTYEVRSHEPTCNADAVCNWIKLHTAFADYFGNINPRQVTRLFRNMSDSQIIRELRVILDETVIDYYVAKSAQSA